MFIIIIFLLIYIKYIIKAGWTKSIQNVRNSIRYLLELSCVTLIIPGSIFIVSTLIDRAEPLSSSYLISITLILIIWAIAAILLSIALYLVVRATCRIFVS